jgi:protein TonB
MPVNAMEPAFPVKDKSPVPAEDVQSGEKAAPSTDSEGANTATPGQGEGPGQTVTSGADSGTGALSSEQWTQLHSAIEQVKTYPRLARERGIEGTVLVRFRALPSGSIEQVDIVKSSGARILDEASITTVYRAAPVPYVDGWVEVPMVYQLKNAEEQ